MIHLAALTYYAARPRPSRPQPHTRRFSASPLTSNTSARNCRPQRESAPAKHLAIGRPHCQPTSPTPSTTHGDGSKNTPGPNRAITGLIRVQGTFGSKDAPDYILGRSGQQGIFTAPIHWHNPLPNIKVEWEKWQTTDTHEDYIQRLLERGHQWGLARGPRGLGARIEAEASTQHTRTWQLDRTPREWTQHTVQDLLQANPAFEHTHIIKKQVRGPTATWWFQATHPKGT